MQASLIRQVWSAIKACLGDPPEVGIQVPDAMLSSAVSSLNYQRHHFPAASIGFFPANNATAVLIERLLQLGVIRGQDVLVHADGEEPACQGLPAIECVSVEKFAANGGRMLYMLEVDAALERQISSWNPEVKGVSITDMLFVHLPSGKEVVARPYRQLSLLYCESVVPPLHFSNFAYIQHLKTIVTPGMRVADICCGPGTVGLSLLRESNIGSMDLIDLNPRAVDMVACNIERNFGAGAAAHAIVSDVFSAVDSGTKWDLIVGNPPHNLDPHGANRHLDKNVYIQAHDPNMSFHRAFFDGAGEHLVDGGAICLLENGDANCITHDHIEALLESYPDYRIENWAHLPLSQFYYITIRKASRGTAMRLS